MSVSARLAFGRGRLLPKHVSFTFPQSDSLRKSIWTPGGKKKMMFSLRCRLGIIRGRTTGNHNHQPVCFLSYYLLPDKSRIFYKIHFYQLSGELFNFTTPHPQPSNFMPYMQLDIPPLDGDVVKFSSSFTCSVKFLYKFVIRGWKKNSSVCKILRIWRHMSNFCTKMNI